MIYLDNEGLEIVLCEPGTYYKGVRFDNGGVFRRITKNGYSFADQWFKTYSPYTHDAVCGCSEEFHEYTFDSLKPGERFCKIGVGLLVKPDEKPYSIFHHYECADSGEWFFSKDSETEATFRHILDGWYEYEKVIVLTSGSSFEIRHRLHWTGSEGFKGFCYNHNFFTFNGIAVDKTRKIDFPFKPAGNWRDEHDSVALTDSGIRFSKPIMLPSVFMENLHNTAGATPYSFSIEENGHKVSVRGRSSVNGMSDLACIDRIVFWSNPEVACVEPYLPIRLEQDETLEWVIEYRLV